MKRVRTILAVVVVALAAGGMGVASADSDHDNHTVSLFTPTLKGLKFVCSTVNVSNKTLGIAINLIDETGVTQNTVSQSVPPGQVFDDGPPITFTNAIVAYCRVDVTGGDRKDVRVDLGGLNPGGVLQGIVQGH